MKSSVVAAILIGSCFYSGPSFAGSTNHTVEKHFGDGEPGAALGTAIYNHYHPTTPLPQSGGTVVEDTMKNIGAGQSAKDAWSNAAKENSGLKDNADQE